MISGSQTFSTYMPFACSDLKTLRFFTNFGKGVFEVGEGAQVDTYHKTNNNNTFNYEVK